MDNVSNLTENFSPKDLKHAAAKIKLKSGLGNQFLTIFNFFFINSHSGGLNATLGINNTRQIALQNVDF